MCEKEIERERERTWREIEIDRRRLTHREIETYRDRQRLIEKDRPKHMEKIAIDRDIAIEKDRDFRQI